MVSRTCRRCLPAPLRDGVESNDYYKNPNMFGWGADGTLQSDSCNHKGQSDPSPVAPSSQKVHRIANTVPAHQKTIHKEFDLVSSSLSLENASLRHLTKNHGSTHHQKNSAMFTMPM